MVTVPTPTYFIMSYNISEETKVKATTGVRMVIVSMMNMFDFLIQLICLLCAKIWYTSSPLLESQSEKQIDRDTYHSKQKNMIRAAARKHTAATKPKKIDPPPSKKKLRRQGKVLQSQVGDKFWGISMNSWIPAFEATFKRAKVVGVPPDTTSTAKPDQPRTYEDGFALGEYYADCASDSKWIKLYFWRVWLKFCSFFGDISIFSAISDDFDLIMRCEIVETAISIVSMLVTLGWLPKTHISYKGVSIFETEALRHQVTLRMVYEALCRVLRLFIEGCHRFPKHGFRGFYTNDQKLKFEIEVAYLRATKVLIDVGRQTEIDSLEFDRRVEQIVQDTLNGMNNAKSTFEKNLLNNVLKEFKAIQSSRILSKRDFVREKPYGILLYGGSAVGKSAMANALVRYVLAVNGFDSSPQSVIALNEFDKFQSEYRTYHSGVIFDDLCNGTVNQTEGNPLMKVIQFINNAPQAALNPNVEMKGNVMIEPKIVLATTNVKTLNARSYTNEPLSIARRFQVTITQSVRPEFCQDGSEMIDPEKILAAFGDDPYPDFALFTVEYACVKPNQAEQRVDYTPFIHMGKTLENIGIRELLEFLSYNSKKHFEQQRCFVSNQKAQSVINLCKCGLPVTLCTDCEMESQFSLMPNLFAPLLQCEEFIYNLVINWLLHILDTPFGQSMLYIHIRKTIYTRLTECYTKDFMISALVFAIILQMIPYYYLAMIGPYFVVTLLVAGIIFIFLLHRMLQAYVRYRIRNIPRVSTYIRNLSFATKMKILGFIGGTATLYAFIKFVQYLRTLPTAQASAPIRVIPKPGAKMEEEHPKWGMSGQREREKAFKIDPEVHHDVRTMTTDHMYSSVKRRQYFLRIADGDMIAFCNCVPIQSNVLLIPNHIVPEKTLPATLSKPGASDKNVLIQPESLYNIPNTDFALWYLPELGDQKDIIEYLPQDIPKGKIFEAFMLYNNNGTIERYDKMLVTRAITRSSKGGAFESLTYSFPGQTFKGLCMATIIANDRDGIPFIGGFHLAGNGSDGAAGFITRDQISAGVKILNDRPGVMISHSAQPFTTSILGVEIGPLVEPHAKAVVHSLKPEAKCAIFGEHNQSRSTPASKVVTSCISDSVERIMSLPKIHGLPFEMKNDIHKLVDFEAKSDTAYKFELDSFNKAYDDYSTQVISGVTTHDLKNVGILSVDAVLAGYDGVQGINSMEFSTAVGFPLKGPKNRFVTESQRFVEGISCPRDCNEEIVQEMLRLEAELRQGKRINAVFKASLKDEPTKYGKTKVRVFGGCNMAFTMLVRKYFLTLSALMQDQKELFECACGLNVYSPQWNTMMIHVFRFGKSRMIAGDYKAFDGKMAIRFMLAAFKILIELAKKSGNFDPEDIVVMNGIAAEISSPTYDHFGTLVQFFGSNPSGHPLTVVINSIVNSLYMRYCYFEIAKTDNWWKVPRFNKVVSLMTYGDDNIMSVKEGYDGFNHTRVAAVLHDAGIEYTMADKESASVPYITAAETGFLKHTAVYDDTLGLYRAVIDENSIQKTLHTHIRSDVLSEEMHSASAITDVLDKYFHFGEDVYNKRKAELEQVAQECKLVGYVGELKTYQDHLLRFCEKYEWPVPPKYAV